MLVSSKCCEFRFLVHERGDLYFAKTKFGKSHLRLLVVGYVIRYYVLEEMFEICNLSVDICTIWL